MTTTEKLTLLLNQANEDFSNVEIVTHWIDDINGTEELTTREFDSFDYYDLIDEDIELRIKDQL